MAMLTTDDLREKFGLVFPATDDARWNELIAVAEAACLHYLGVSAFGTAVFTEYHDGGADPGTDGKRKSLVLRSQPVVSVGSVTVGGAVMDKTGYRLDGTVLYLYGDIPEGTDNVVVEYTAGWTADTLPHDIRYCIAVTVQYLAKLGSSNEIGVTQRATDGGTESLEQAIPPFAVQKALDCYRMGRAC